MLREGPCLRPVCKGSRMRPNPHVSQRQQRCIPLSPTCVVWPTCPFPCSRRAPFLRADDPIFFLDLVDEVPCVTTGCDEFSAFFRQCCKRVLSVFVDGGHSFEINHAFPFPASVFCFPP